MVLCIKKVLYTLLNRIEWVKGRIDNQNMINSILITLGAQYNLWGVACFRNNIMLNTIPHKRVINHLIINRNEDYTLTNL